MPEEAAAAGHRRGSTASTSGGSQKPRRGRRDSTRGGGIRSSAADSPKDSLAQSADALAALAEDHSDAPSSTADDSADASLAMSDPTATSGCTGSAAAAGGSGLAPGGGRGGRHATTTRGGEQEELNEASAAVVRDAMLYWALIAIAAVAQSHASSRQALYNAPALLELLVSLVTDIRAYEDDMLPGAADDAPPGAGSSSGGAGAASMGGAGGGGMRAERASERARRSSGLSSAQAEKAVAAHSAAAELDAKAVKLEARAKKLRAAEQGQKTAARLAGLGPRASPRTSQMAHEAAAVAAQARAKANKAMAAAKGAAQAARDGVLAGDEEWGVDITDDDPATQAGGPVSARSRSADAANEASTGQSSRSPPSVLVGTPHDAAVEPAEPKAVSRVLELSDLAGEILTCLLLHGDEATADLIVSGIVRAVTDRGAVPPTRFPEIMALMQTAARERLIALQHSVDEAALEQALEFGKWMRLPTRFLCEVRDAFRKSQQRHDYAQREQRQRQALGLCDESGAFIARLGAKSPRVAARAVDLDAAAASASRAATDQASHTFSVRWPRR